MNGWFPQRVPKGASREPGSLDLQSFEDLYLVSFATSTIFLILSLICLPTNRQQHQVVSEGEVNLVEESAFKFQESNKTCERLEDKKYKYISNTRRNC